MGLVFEAGSCICEIEGEEEGVLIAASSEDGIWIWDFCIAIGVVGDF